MGDPMLDRMAALVIKQIAAAFEDSLPPADVQIIVRPIGSWPDGRESAVWVTINWPN